jgi:hypothetical protein
MKALPRHGDRVDCQGTVRDSGNVLGDGRVSLEFSFCGAHQMPGDKSPAMQA